APRELHATPTTIGHVHDYLSHRLDPSGEKLPVPVLTGQQEAAKCACNSYCSSANPPPVDLFDAELKRYREWTAAWRPGGHYRPEWVQDYTLGQSLKRIRNDANGTSPDNPFWVVRASPEIIDGHNGFYTPLFFEFIRQVYDQIIIDRELAAPVPGVPPPRSSR